jgi:UDP-N-acetyl-D-glucosamine dehydrogenase
MIAGRQVRELERALAAREARVAVMGLGYGGLPLALALAGRRFGVVGLDVCEDKVAALNAGRSYILDVRAQDVARAVGEGRLRASTDPAGLAGADAVCICVPTPFTPQKEPDTSAIAAAAREGARHGRPGQLVVLRSTSYPGTTEEVVRRILEASGRRYWAQRWRRRFAVERLAGLSDRPRSGRPPRRSRPPAGPTRRPRLYSV